MAAVAALRNCVYVLHNTAGTCLADVAGRGGSFDWVNSYTLRACSHGSSAAFTGAAGWDHVRLSSFCRRLQTHWFRVHLDSAYFTGFNP